MCRIVHPSLVGLLLAFALQAVTPVESEAQGRSQPRGTPTQADTLSLEVKVQIREYYASHPVAGARALPPGIRRNLERGKELPPGIAKKVAPQELQSQVGVPEGFELVEVGLDVLLVEVATNIIHDVLMDIIGRAPIPPWKTGPATT